MSLFINQWLNIATFCFSPTPDDPTKPYLESQIRKTQGALFLSLTRASKRISSLPKMVVYLLNKCIMCKKPGWTTVADKTYCCDHCATPRCPACNSTDVVFEALTQDGRRTVHIKRCLDQHCNYRGDIAPNMCPHCHSIDTVAFTRLVDGIKRRHIFRCHSCQYTRVVQKRLIAPEPTQVE